MNFIAETLWDLLRRGERSSHRTPPKPHAKQAAKRPRPEADSQQRRRPAIQHRYDALVIEMKQTYDLRVRKWRSSTSGCAWVVMYEDGTTSRLIESPYPRGPMSCAVFLHEVGHHAIGLGAYRPRCLEEYHAWRWSLETMRQRGFNVTAAVEKRMADSLRYAVDKAVRRGMKRLPAELVPFARPEFVIGRGSVA